MGRQFLSIFTVDMVSNCRKYTVLSSEVFQSLDMVGHCRLCTVLSSKCSTVQRQSLNSNLAHMSVASLACLAGGYISVQVIRQTITSFHYQFDHWQQLSFSGPNMAHSTALMVFPSRTDIIELQYRHKTLCMLWILPGTISWTPRTVRFKRLATYFSDAKVHNNYTTGQHDCSAGSYMRMADIVFRDEITNFCIIYALHPIESAAGEYPQFCCSHPSLILIRMFLHSNMFREFSNYNHGWSITWFYPVYNARCKSAMNVVG